MESSERSKSINRRYRQRLTFGKCRKATIWKWAHEYEEYEIVHREGGWEVRRLSGVCFADARQFTPYIKATSQRTGEIEAKFLVPYRPRLFGKQPPVTLEISRMALSRDEVFLILAMIYLEAKRQERMVSIPPLLSQGQVLIASLADFGRITQRG